MTTVFIVLGNPIGKARARTTSAGGIGTKESTSSHTMTPAKTKKYKHDIQTIAKRAHAGKELLTGAISVTIDMRFPIPKSWPEGKRRAAIAGLIRPLVKPDIDNVEKSVYDACNGVVWGDDSMIVDNDNHKWYAEQPCIVVTVESLEVDGE